MNYTGIFFGHSKDSAKCVAKIKGRIDSRLREEYEEEARLQGTKAFFFSCSENQKINSLVLK